MRTQIRSGAAVAACIAAVVGGWTATARAQAGDMSARLERQLRQAERSYMLQPSPALGVGERALIDYGALVTFGFLAIDDTEQNTRILRQTDARLYGLVNIDGVHQFYGRLRFNYEDFNSGDSFDGRGDELEDPIGDRWWYMFDLRRAVEVNTGEPFADNLRIQAGRFFADWASGLVFSDELYGARLWYEKGNLFEIEVLGGVTPSSTVIDFDASRPAFDSDTERAFIGGKFTLLTFPEHRPYLYVLHQNDNNDQDSALLNIGGVFVPTEFNYDSTYFGVGSEGPITGRIDYLVEAVLETGEGLSNSFDPVTLAAAPQTEEDILAWAARLRFGYNALDANQTRVELEALLASGDDDRTFDTSNTFGGNTSGTDDEAFNAFGFVNTGLAFAPPVSNLAMVRAGATTFPFRNSRGILRGLSIGVDGILFNKLDSDAPIDEATSDDTILGYEIDLYADWQVLSDVAVFLRYGVFFPGEAIEADSDPRHFFFTGVTYAF